MKKFIQELQRRSVFRVAGLYVGVAWIAIQAGTTILPILGAPDWSVRALVIVAMAGFPIAMVLAWLYEVTDKGLQREEQVDVERTKYDSSDRKWTYAAIGVLVMALGISLFLNFRKGGEVAPESIERKTVLISDFDNKTGDPVFGGTMEQAMLIGLEGASFITTFPRDQALKVANSIKPGSTLDAETARLVAVREGVQLVLQGSVASKGSAYEIFVSAIDVATGKELASESAEAPDKLAVLAKVGEVAAGIRGDLGDVTVDDEAAKNETFTAASLEAVHEYTIAQELARQGKHEEAIEHYRAAVKEDPNFARARSGWGLAAFKLGRRSEADEQWKLAMEKLDTMTEREKFRTLGVYYTLVANNRDKAIENYEALVQKYPADGAGHNNLAVAYFMSLNFAKAMEHGGQVLQLYPKKALYRSNLALYAMYAGKMDVATKEAQEVLKDSPDYVKAYVPLAVAATVAGDRAKASATYDSMTKAAGGPGASLAATGEADLALMAGEASAVAEQLTAAIATDLQNGNQAGAVDKLLLTAEAQAAQGQKDQALATLAKIEGQFGRDTQRFAYARLLLQLGKSTEALEIASQLVQTVDQQTRAWGRLIEAENALLQKKPVDALDILKKSRELADLWLGHMLGGRAYLEAGAPTEAMAEFDEAKKRQGEAVAMYLDDVPTLRNLPEIEYWLGRAQQEMKLGDAARGSFDRYMTLRPSGTDPMSVDARSRRAAL